MKYEKRTEEAEDRKDEYHEYRNAEYNLEKRSEIVRRTL